MVTKKRSASLDALENNLAREVGPEETQEERAPATAAPDKGAPSPKKKRMQLPTYMPPPVHEQLRRLAFEERTSINALTLEAYDLLFKQRGLKSIEALTRPE